MKEEIDCDDKHEASAGEYLLRRGNTFRQVGKYSFSIGLVLLMIIIIYVAASNIGINSVWDLYKTSVILAILTFLSSICLCCLPLYFIGLHYIGLGQIAENTNRNTR